MQGVISVCTPVHAKSTKSKVLFDSLMIGKYEVTPLLCPRGTPARNVRVCGSLSAGRVLEHYFHGNTKYVNYFQINPS